MTDINFDYLRDLSDIQQTIFHVGSSGVPLDDLISQGFIQHHGIFVRDYRVVSLAYLHRNGYYDFQAVMRKVNGG